MPVRIHASHGRNKNRAKIKIFPLSLYIPTNLCNKEEKKKKKRKGNCLRQTSFDLSPRGSPPQFFFFVLFLSFPRATQQRGLFVALQQTQKDAPSPFFHLFFFFFLFLFFFLFPLRHLLRAWPVRPHHPFGLRSAPAMNRFGKRMFCLS